MAKQAPIFRDDLTKQLKSFTAWLIEQGADVQEPTNGWEMLRVRAEGKTYIVYTNAKGQLRWPDLLRGAWSAWKRGNSNFKGFTRVYGRGHRGRVIVERLRKRDGDDCFFCGYFVEPEDATVEHLVGLKQGGPNRLANFALAHEDCNQLAGNLPLTKKVKLRDTLRTRCWELAPWLDRPDLSEVMQ